MPKPPLLALLGALVLPMTAPVSATTLSDNLAEPVFDISAINNTLWQAQKFMTTASAFRVTEVAVQISEEVYTTGQLLFTIYDATGPGGTPGAQVALVGSVDAGSIGTSFAGVDLPNLNISLSPDTHYFLVLQGRNVGSSDPYFEAPGTFFWAYTDSTSGTGAGFLPAYTSTDNSGASWVALDTSFPQMMRIEADGGSAPVPELDAASGTGALALLIGALSWIAERRRTTG